MKRASSTKAARPLSVREILLIPAGFREAFDPEKVRFIPRAHNIFARNKILVRGDDIYWPDVPDDFTREDILIQSVLIHELCHVWQYKTGRLTALRYLFNPMNWYYSYTFDPKKSFDDYRIEKQADLLQDWYLMNSGEKPIRYKGASPTLTQINSVVPFRADETPQTV